MKNVKKLAGLLLALVMLMSLTTTAFAATVTLPADEILAGHSFTAYQVFTGREENGVLSDIQWGTGINSTAFLAALKADPTYGALFAACTTAAQVANVLGDNNTNTALANKVAKIAEDYKAGDGIALVSGENELADGYYLIVDTTTNVGEGSAYNAALLQVVGDIDIQVKTDAPTVEKKVKEDDKYDKYNTNDGYGVGYNDVADYNIGEAVPFTLIGSVPDMSRYDTYKYIFHDTLSAGLTPPAESGIVVYLSADKAVGAGDSIVTSSFDIDVTGQVITVSSNNIKNILGIAEGMYLIVAYNAVLNENADIGLPGNENTVYLEYSNKPDQSGAGDTDNTGETPEDKAIVFTYELDTTKVDGKNTSTKLQGAQFVLLNADASKVAKITNGKFDGWQNIPAAGPGGVITWPADSILTSAADTGLFSVTGLDDGTYRLREIVAPAGYNLLTADIVVIITATTANGQTWNGVPGTALTHLAVTADGVAGTADITTGIAAITIANNAGSTLPETGGIGTTLFYIAGAVLVLAAVVLLVTKKRMKHSEK
ncbi:MAG: isopeptide-forming domain-containing fimbrial protein [Acutalibacteraceae bacterium]